MFSNKSGIRLIGMNAMRVSSEFSTGGAGFLSGNWGAPGIGRAGVVRALAYVKEV